MLLIINLCIYGLYLYIYKYVFLFRKKLNKFFFVYCKVCLILRKKKFFILYNFCVYFLLLIREEREDFMICIYCY